MISLHVVDESIDPTPLTVEGTTALVDRFYALRRDGRLEVGVGGPGAAPGYGSHPPAGPKKIKSIFIDDSTCSCGALVWSECQCETGK